MTSRNQSVHKLYAFALAAVFALTLAGCGGGGGGGATAPVDPPAPVDPGPTPEEMEAQALSDAQDAAMAAYMAAAAAVAGAVDPVAITNAQMYADAAKEASDAAAAATTSAMAGEYQAAAEAAQASAEMAAGERGLGTTALANKIINQSDIDNAVLEGKTGDDVPKPVSNAVRVGAALDVAAAATAAVAETPAGAGGTPAAVPNGSVSQGGAASGRATHGASGPRVSVTMPTGVGDAVTRGESPTSLTTRGGWIGAELVGGATGATNSMTYAAAYTDINSPTQAYTDPTPGANTQLTLATAPATSIVTGDIPGDGSSFTGTWNEDSTDNDPPVSGKFVCPSGTTGGCSISVDANGVVKALQGYEFHAKSTVSMADTDYLAWGTWLTVPNARPVTGTPNAATAGAFASGNDVFQVRAELKGTATYNGVASGMYSAGGMVEYFDADVMLEANFGGTVGADNSPATPDANDGELLGAVNGTVSNIRAGGMDVAGSLTLKRAPITGPSGTPNGDSSDGFMGDVSGTLAGRAMVGEWGGQFYGPNRATADSMPAQTEYPTTAAGTFGASAPGNVNDPVRILGAFGTWKAE